MRIKPLHHNFTKPTKGTEGAGAFDIYMPQSGDAYGNSPTKVGLGFAAEVPVGNVALIFPRSGVGSKYGVELNNTCGVIDSDYRGEWIANIRTKSGDHFSWDCNDRVLQFLIVPITDVTLDIVEDLETTERGSNGLGSSGK